MSSLAKDQADPQMSPRPAGDVSPGPGGAKLLSRLSPRTARWARVSLGALVGGALGLAYYAWVGCATGSCPITSSPVTSTLYGLLVGGLVAFR